MNTVGKQAAIVFFGSAIFTVVFVVATLVARHHENQSPFLIALPSSIALYFSNVMTHLIAGGFNNPIVGLIISLQNRKYFAYSPVNTPLFA